MLHRRFYGIAPAKDVDGFRIASSVRDVAKKQATMLRDRAARCRQLATTFYDRRIISELETYASELETEAMRLGLSRRSSRGISDG